MKVQPYITLNGRTEEAANFYKVAVGAQIKTLMRWKEAPMPAEMRPPGSDDKVMHLDMTIGESTVLMSDGDLKSDGKVENAALTIVEVSVAEGEDKFAKLSEGGTIVMPMDKTFFAERFGMLVDKFGLKWMVVVGG